MLPGMVVGLAIKCDWRGCKAAIDAGSKALTIF